MKMLLLDRNCWSFIEDKEEELDKSATRREKQDFTLRENRAFTTLYYGIKTEFRPLIQECSSGKEAWEVLQKQFEPKTRARIIQLLDEFFSIRYTPDEEIGLFIARIRMTAKKLAEAGHNLADLFKGFQAIRRLPQEYSGIVQLIYRWKDEDFTLEKIAEELVREESRLRQVNADLEDSKVSVFNTISSNAGKNRDESKFKSKKKLGNTRIGPCFRCQKFGHVIAQCKENVSKNQKFKIDDKNGQFKDKELMLVENYVTTTDKGCNADKFNWVVDTAATTHFCNNRNLMINFEEINDIRMSLAVGNCESKVLGKGTVKFAVKVGNRINWIELDNVLYNPNLRRNLLSGARLEKAGAHFVVSNGKMWIYFNNWDKLCYAKRYDGLYHVKPFRYATDKKEAGYGTETRKLNKVDDATLWHRRFCHVNFDYIQNTSKNQSVKGLPEIEKPMEKCEPCIIAKSSRITFKTLPKRSDKPLQLVYLDVCGPLPVPSKGGSKYFLAIVDDYSRLVTVYCMKNKNESFYNFKNYHRQMERLTNRKLISIRTDNGGEFCNKQFERYLAENGISVERTNAYTPEENGVCERFNRTALDAVKAMLNDSKMGKEWWAEALGCFVHTWNRVCHKSNRTPYEMFLNRKPSVVYFKVFGCKAYVGVPKQIRNKLQMRCREGIMVGYAKETRGYRIWLPEERRLIETCNVKFDEKVNAVDDILDQKSKTKFKRLEESELLAESDEEQETSRKELKSSEDKSIPKEVSDLNWQRKAVKRPDGTRTDIYYYVEGTDTRFRSHNDIEKYCEARNIKFEKDKFDFSGRNEYSGKVNFVEQETSSVSEEANSVEIVIPQNFEEARKSVNAEEWSKAMKEEIETMKKRNVWELVEKPENKTMLGTKWVYTLKRNEKNEVVRYKARLVAQGFRQKRGEDFDDVYSPVVNFSIIRIFFTILVCLYGWTNCQLDVKNAYLYANLNEKIYMTQPEGFIEEENKVCLLHKAIYGLHQSGREWFCEFESTLENLHFKKIQWCNCVYKGSNVILLLYVDDIVIFSKDQHSIDKVISQLSKFFDLKVLGKTKTLLGIEFLENENGLFIHQQNYIEEIFEKFKHFQIPVTSVPIAKGTILTKLDCPSTSAEMRKLPFRNLLGCLVFVANRTRPDITYAVNILSQFQENPGIRHWEALLKLLGYLNSTKLYKLNLSRIKHLNLYCYSDADYASNRDDRVSMGGFILYLDEVPVIWKTVKQNKMAQKRKLDSYDDDYDCDTESLSSFESDEDFNSISSDEEDFSSVRQWCIIDSSSHAPSRFSFTGDVADDIYNADETGLYYHVTADSSLSYKHIALSGSKKAMDSITILCCSNMSGTDKRKLLVIGKGTKPRCFKGLRIDSLPVVYCANRNAWMTSELFKEWLKDWDRELQCQSIKVLLLLDNCTAHPHLHCLKNIQQEFLPPTTTALVQPMDRGIIKNLKNFYLQVENQKVYPPIEEARKIAQKRPDGYRNVHRKDMISIINLVILK
ncbi:Copia protein, partial [Stegodyphus mimosarum]